jgi:myo-inositol 2-dehydrogenase/D-chiro-inositol 1-dehydrogenase
LLGAGFIGSVHAASLAGHRGVDFVGVYDVDRPRAEAVAAEHRTAVMGLDEAFDPARVDAVLIASSTDTHAEHLHRAADAGIAAICEKPIDAELRAAVEIVRHVQASGVAVMVDFNRRFDRDNAELRRQVAAGEVGAVELLQLSSRGPAVPPLSYVAVSGGQLRDQTVHFFDLARWIAGADPVEVYATGSALAEPRLAEYGDVDTSVAVLRLPTGAVVQIDSVRRTGYGYDERIEVHGSDALLEARPHRTGSVLRYRDGAVIADGLPSGWFERVAATYPAALDAFVAALEGGPSDYPTLTDGLKAQAIAEAATRSLSTGRAEPIEYPDLPA